MRIITGSAKGRKLAVPQGMDTRPTSDRVKQSLFNILSIRVIDAKVLDAFAGTGNLGLEALSQGAESAVFIENNRNTLKVLQKNVEDLGFQECASIYSSDTLEVLRELQRRAMSFDLIFLDPPYGRGLIEKTIEKISEFSLLGTEGIIISEQDAVDAVPDKVQKISCYRREKYGRTQIAFWRWEAHHE